MIIPAFNSDRFVIDAIKSVESQDYGTIDIVCVDDGSTDNTWDIVNKYKEISRLHIRLIHQSNRGVSAARNTGIEHADGKYLFFLDADDEIPPVAISALVKGIMGDKDISYGSWIGDRKLLSKSLPQGRAVGIKHINEAYMYRRRRLVFASFLYKKEIIDSNHIRFDESLKYGEDNLFLWNYLCYVNKGTEYVEPIYYYNQNENSAVHRISWRITDSVRAVYKAVNYFTENDYSQLQEFKEYMPQRTVFYVAKEFAIYGKKGLFRRLLKEYDARSLMRSLYYKNGLVLTMSAKLLANVPALFYLIMRMYGKITKVKHNYSGL